MLKHVVLGSRNHVNVAKWVMCEQISIQRNRAVTVVGKVQNRCGWFENECGSVEMGVKCQNGVLVVEMRARAVVGKRRRGTMILSKKLLSIAIDDADSSYLC